MSYDPIQCHYHGSNGRCTALSANHFCEDHADSDVATEFFAGLLQALEDGDRRTQGERRDGKDRRAWGTIANEASHPSRERRNRLPQDRRQTDRRQGGEG